MMLMPYACYTPVPDGCSLYAVYQQPTAEPVPPQPGYPLQY